MMFERSQFKVFVSTIRSLNMMMYVDVFYLISDRTRFNAVHSMTIFH